MVNEPGGNEPGDKSKLSHLYQQVRDGADLKRSELFDLLKRPDDKPNLNQKTFWESTSRHDLRDVLGLKQCRQVVAPLTLMDADGLGDVGRSALRTVQATVDYELIGQLLEAGVLRYFLTADGHPLFWLFTASQDLNRDIARWTRAAVDGTPFLFWSTFRLWNMIRAEKLNETVSIMLASPMAFVAITHAFYVDAITIADYWLDRTSSARDDYTRMERVRMTCLKATAYMCIRGSTEARIAEMLFHEATNEVEQLKVDCWDKEDVKPKLAEIERAVHRERVRAAMRPVWPTLKNIWSDRKTKVTPQQEALKRTLIQFESLMKDMASDSPVDYDTIARAYTMIGLSQPDYLERAKPYLDRGQQLYLEGKDDEADPAPSLLVADSLAATSVLFYAAKEMWDEVRKHHKIYLGLRKVEDRRHTRPVARALEQILLQARIA